MKHYTISHSTISLTLFISLFLIIQNTLKCQEYIPLPENNAVWTEMNGIYEGFPPQSWTSLFITETDTTLLDQFYKNIYEYYLNPSTFDTIRELYASIRQDAITERVYIIRHYLNETKERLLMDFNIQTNDTVILDAYIWDIDPLNTDSIFIVDSISEITLNNNQKRRIQYLSTQNTPFPKPQIIIEGVGSIFNPFGPATDLVNKQQPKSSFCCPDFLLCLTVEGENVYVHMNETDCSKLQILTSTKPILQETTLNLYPNPTNGLYRIKINSEYTQERLFEIYDLMGRKVLHRKFYQNDITIDLGSLKPGTYITQIWCDDTPITKKLIISP